MSKTRFYLLLFIFIYDNESNKEIKENQERKYREPDIRLRVFRGSLPDFVAADPVRLKFIFGGYLPMRDEWSGFADLMASLIEKYAADLDLDNLPDPKDMPKRQENDSMSEKTTELYIADRKAA